MANRTLFSLVFVFDCCCLDVRKGGWIYIPPLCFAISGESYIAYIAASFGGSVSFDFDPNSSVFFFFVYFVVEGGLCIFNTG